MYITRKRDVGWERVNSVQSSYEYIQTMFSLFHVQPVLACCLLFPTTVAGVTPDIVYGSAKYHWSFDEYYEMGDTGNYITPDEGGISNGYVLASGVPFVSLVEGVVNNSLSINGTTTVYLGDASGTCLSDPIICTVGLSAALWVHISDEQSNPCVVFTSGADTGGSRGFYLRYQGSNSGLLKFYVHDGTKYWTSDVDFATFQANNFWNHVAMVWNTTGTDATLTVFVNGEEETSESLGIDNTIPDNVDNTLYLNGDTAETEMCIAQYDELALWEDGIDYMDVDAIYQQGSNQLYEPSTTPSSSTVQSTTPGVTTGSYSVMSSIHSANIHLADNGVTASGAKLLAEKVANLTTSNEHMTSEELSLTLDILSKLSGLNSNLDSIATTDEKTAIRNSFIETVNELVDASKSGIWDKTVAANIDASAYLMGIVDDYAETLLSDADFQVFEAIHKNIEMKAIATLDDNDIIIEMNDGDATVTIPVTAFSPGIVNRRVIATVISEMPRLANARIERKSNYSGKVVNSAVIAVDISKRASGIFKDDVTLVFRTKNITFSNPECVFLDNGGDWSTTGCLVDDLGSSNIQCKCNHLTNFAVLMSMNSIKLSHANEIALQVITYVGCSISLICLFFALVLLLVLRELSSSRITILKNLIVALLLAEVLFMTGIRATESTMLCTIIAIFLHYLYLSVFSWMLVQGIQLLVKIRKVFDSNIRVLHFCLLGWGLPALVVSVTLAIDHHGYGTASHCWLSTVRHTIWAFIGPALIVISVNTVVLIMVIRVFMSVKSNKDKTEIQKIRSGFRATALLLPLLGLTWAFGLLSIDETTVAFQYIFAILNSLQGLFIFVFHCVMNDEVKSALNTRHKKLLSQSDHDSGLFTKIIRSGRSAVAPEDSSSVTRSTRATATATAM
ncbi:adhesion G-protein coupled receptor D1-like [Glandiceps talaboti]